MPSLWLLGLFGVALCIGYLWLESKKRSQKYFPSPPSEPILGHLRVFPQDTPWTVFADWTKKYGSIIRLSIAASTILVLNKAEDAHELLEKRGSNYSDRVRAVLLGELGGLEYFSAFIRYGDDFRTTRRYISQYFNSREHMYLYPLLADQVKILLKNLFNDPQKFEAHFDRSSAGTVIKATYGDDSLSKNEDYIKLAADAVTDVFSLGMAGLSPLDLFPFLRHVPSWLPGAGLLRRAHSARKLVDRMVDEPYEGVKAQRKAGIDQSSFVDALLGDYEQEGVVNEKHELLIKNTAAQILAGGIETSADALQTFIFMMMEHPEVVKKAQAEIDRVIGSERLPSLEDRPDLPYIECIVKEVLRYNPPIPLGVPHGSLKEDVYKDKVIPAGTLVVTNIWAMMRDERHFPDPHIFNPDRFSKLTASEDDKHVHSLNRFRPDDPSSLVFGFGRRICPGRFFADASAWLFMANILAIFDVLPPVDPVTGKEYMPRFDWVGGMIGKLKPFHARIVPRSEKHALLIQQQC